MSHSLKGRSRRPKFSPRRSNHAWPDPAFRYPKFVGRKPELDPDADDGLMRKLADGIQEMPKERILCPPQRFVLLCTASWLRCCYRILNADDYVDRTDIRELTQESSLLHQGLSARRVWDGVDRNGRELDVVYTLEGAVDEVERRVILAICEV